MLIYPECGHEWNPATADFTGEHLSKVKDANGNDMFDGDNATLIKDLKVKRSSSVLKNSGLGSTASH